MDETPTPSLKSPLNVKCPSCGADPGVPCVSMTTAKPMVMFHSTRMTRVIEMRAAR